MADEYVNMDQETHEMGKNVKHTDYIYDLGEFPVKHGNLQRFRDTYASNRPEYSGHAFKAPLGIGWCILSDRKTKYFSLSPT